MVSSQTLLAWKLLRTPLCPLLSRPKAVVRSVKDFIVWQTEMDSLARGHRARVTYHQQQ